MFENILKKFQLLPNIRSTLAKLVHHIEMYSIHRNKISVITPVYCDKTAEARNTRFTLKSTQCHGISCVKFDDKIPRGFLEWSIRIVWVVFDIEALYLGNCAR